jgi:hypothetical protein
VLVEELRADEERLVQVQPADETVDVETEREVERVALEDAALDGTLAVQEQEPGVDERIEAALDVVQLLEPPEARRARRIVRELALAGPGGSSSSPLEVRRLGADDAA